MPRWRIWRNQSSGIWARVLGAVWTTTPEFAHDDERTWAARSLLQHAESLDHARSVGAATDVHQPEARLPPAAASDSSSCNTQERPSNASMVLSQRRCYHGSLTSLRWRGRTTETRCDLRCLPLLLSGGARRSIARTPTRVKALSGQHRRLPRGPRRNRGRHGLHHAAAVGVGLLQTRRAYCNRHSGEGQRGQPQGRIAQCFLRYRAPARPLLQEAMEKVCYRHNWVRNALAASLNRVQAVLEPMVMTRRARGDERRGNIKGDLMDPGRGQHLPGLTTPRQQGHRHNPWQGSSDLRRARRRRRTATSWPSVFSVGDQQLLQYCMPTCRCCLTDTSRISIRAVFKF